MSLELQLSTSKARQELQQVEKSINSLTTAMNKVGSNASKFNELGKAMSGVKGINAATVKNLNGLATALQKIKTPPGLNTLAKNLGNLAAIGLGKVAGDVNRFSKALNSIKAPANLSKIAVDLRQIATAAVKAAGAMERFKAATVGIRTPPALQAINRQMNTLPGAFNKANSAAMAFNNSIRTLRNVGGALAAALGAFGVGKFVQGATQATMTLEQFKVVMTTVTGSTEEAGKALDFVKGLSKELAISTGTLAASFQKFAAAAVTSGMSMENTQAIYKSFATSFRVLGLSAEDQRLGFLALEQMISKSTVSMEELRRQLGERLPGAFSIAAKAMGKSTTEFSKMIANGQVLSTELLPKMAAAVDQLFGEGLPAAMQKTSAALSSLEAQWWDFQQAFGEEFWNQARDAVFGLAEAMESPAFEQFARDLGKIAGWLASEGIKAVTWLVDNIWALKAAVAAVSLGGFALSLGAVLKFVQLLASPLKLVAGLLGGFRGAVVALSGAPAIFKGITTAVGLLRIAFVALMASPLAAWITGISLAVSAAIAVYELWNGASEETAAEQAKLAESAKKMEEGLKGANQALEPLPGQLTKSQEEARKFGQTFKASGGEVSTFNANAGDTPGILNDFEQAAADSGKEADKLADETGKAAKASGELADGSAEAAGKLAQAAAKAKEAQRAYEALARAARDAAKAMNAANAAGGGSAGSGRKGGMAGNLPQSQAVPPGAFVGAPQFADGTTNTSKYMGTLPGGGIPSILHPNEAVIPLSGGRSIPVELKNGDAGTGSYSRLIEDLRGDVGGSRALDDDAVTWMIKLTEMMHILNGNLEAGGEVGGASVWSPMINSVLNAMQSASASGVATGGGPTIGGSFSVNMGGGSSGGFSGAYAALNPQSDANVAMAERSGKFAQEILGKFPIKQDRALALAQAFIEKFNIDNMSDLQDFYNARFRETDSDVARKILYPEGFFWPSWDAFFRAGGAKGMDLKSENYGKSTGPDFHMMADMMGVDKAANYAFGTGPMGAIGRGGWKGYVIGKPLNKLKGAARETQDLYKTGYLNKDGSMGKNFSTFAMGSPNAYNDAMGRPAATVGIHPNEAIIPLPDGRSVPVVFPEERSGGYGGGRGNQAGNFDSRDNVNVGGVTIVANNPLEFEQAQNKIESQVKKAMERARRRTGLSESYR